MDSPLPKHPKPTTNADLQCISISIVDYLHSLDLIVNQTTKVENNNYTISISLELPKPTPSTTIAIPTPHPATLQSSTQSHHPTPPYNHPDNSKQRIQNLQEPQKSIYDRLRQLRILLAKEANVDLYIIASNAMLLELIDNMPRTIEQISALKGFGPTKSSKYGPRILTALHGSSLSTASPAITPPSTPLTMSSNPIPLSPTCTIHPPTNPISQPPISTLSLQSQTPTSTVEKGMSSGERIVRDRLEALNITYIHQQPLVTVGNPNMGGGGLTFDFYLPTLTLAIEVDGEQHRKPVEKYGGIKGFISTLRCDMLKREWCEHHHTSLLRVTYDELEDIDTRILNTINLIRTVPLDKLPVIIDPFHEERKRLYAHYTTTNVPTQ